MLYNSVTGVGLYQQRIEAQFSTGDMIGFNKSVGNASSVVLRYINNTGETIIDNTQPSLLMLPLVAVDTSEIGMMMAITGCSCVCVSLQITESVGLCFPVERAWSTQWVSIWPLREHNCSKTAQQ